MGLGASLPWRWVRPVVLEQGSMWLGNRGGNLETDLHAGRRRHEQKMTMHRLSREAWNESSQFSEGTKPANTLISDL